MRGPDDARTPASVDRAPAAGRPPASGRSFTELPSDRSARLTALIRAEIESSPDRRITFARYMELALYEPELGYYRRPPTAPPTPATS